MVAYAYNGCIGQNECSLNMTRIVSSSCWNVLSADKKCIIHYECVSSDRIFQNCTGSLFVQNSTNLDQEPPNEQCVSEKQYIVSNRSHFNSENEKCSIDVDMAYLPANVTVKLTILYCSILTKVDGHKICNQSLVTNKTLIKSRPHWNLQFITMSAKEPNLGLILQLEGKPQTLFFFSNMNSWYTAVCV